MARTFGNVTTDNIALGNDTSIAPSTTMTIGAWINPTAISQNGTILNYASTTAAGKGFTFTLNASGGTLHLVKLGAVDLNSTLAISTAAWTFVAAVVTATQVRFVRITNAGVLTGANIADSNVFATGASNALVGGQQNGSTSIVNPFNGGIAWVGVNVGTALSDANLQTAAFNPTTTWFPSLLLPLGGGTEIDLTGLAPSVTVNGTTADSANPPNVLPYNLTAPTVSGSAPVGSVLSTTNGTWADTPTSFTYQWTSNGTNIVGATASSYTTQAGDSGTAVGCTVTATNTGASAATPSSNTVTVTGGGATSGSASGGVNFPIVFFNN